MSETIVENVERREFAGAEVEIFRGGAGPALLLLHGSYGWWGWEPIHERLAQQFTVIAPSHPGFGRSTRNLRIDTIDDLAYFYLDLVEELGLAPARIVGFGMGGWIAAEMAVRSSNAIDRLVLVGSVGIKISDRETRDIGDPWILVGDEQQPMFWHDPSTQRVPLPQPGMPEEMLERMLRNGESAMLYGWKPYMHNPKLLQRLHRIKARTLVVWGDDDRIVSTDYGQTFAGAIPNARFTTIPGAGHYPHREQLDAFVRPVTEFLSS